MIGYLINMKYIELFKKQKLFFLFFSIFIFSFFYYQLGHEHYHVRITNKLDYFEALYLSIVTQSLLGPGDILPKTNMARITLMIQVLITIFITFM